MCPRAKPPARFLHTADPGCRPPGLSFVTVVDRSRTAVFLFWKKKPNPLGDGVLGWVSKEMNKERTKKEMYLVQDVLQNMIVCLIKQINMDLQNHSLFHAIFASSLGAAHGVLATF